MKLDKTEEKRRFHRIFYQAKAIIEAGNKCYPCNIIDISLKGCMLEAEDFLPERPEILFTLMLSLSEEIQISMQLRVAHQNGNQFGCECIHIDIDSISNLRRLVELNLGDSELLERELSALSGY
jgi:hypothetical protein